MYSQKNIYYGVMNVINFITFRIYIYFFFFREGLRNAEVQTVAKQDIYDIVATANYSDKELESPTTFECVLKIPEANYQVARTTLYYPGTDKTIFT